MTVLKSFGLGALPLVVLGACADVTSVPGGSGAGADGPVVIEEGGAAYNVSLASLSAGCSDPALASLDCTETSVRSKVTRAGSSFVGTEDERAAARLATQRACEAKGMTAGRFSLTDGNFQSGIWVFDDACL